MSTPITPAQKKQAVQDFVSGLTLPPAAQTTRVRNMSWEQARDIVFALHNQQRLKLQDSTFNLFTAKRDADDNIVVTPPDAPRNGTGTNADTAGRYTIQPDKIGGVQFKYIKSFNATTGDIAESFSQPYLYNLDPRLIVLLAWLCEKLRPWGVTTLYHLGFAGDAKHLPTNCHWWGRACDFAGVGGEVGWGKYDITILKHWGMQQITMPADWPAGGRDPKTSALRYAKGTKWPQWPDNFQATNYRINPPVVTGDNYGEFLAMDAIVMFASRVFRDVYDLAANEGRDTDNPHDDPTTVGSANTSICHPDHHDTSLRKDHKNHIHMQIGPTENVGFWKG
jgi:hypothetical protein